MPKIMDRTRIIYTDIVQEKEKSTKNLAGIECSSRGNEKKETKVGARPKGHPGDEESYLYERVPI